jgi:chromosome segregation ATPase
MDAEMYKKQLKEENEKLLYQTQNLNQHINDLNGEINTLNQSLNQCKYSNDDLKDKLNILQNANRNMQDKIDMLQSANDDLKNKLDMLSHENEELNRIINEQKNDLNVNDDEKKTYINEIKKLNELLEKYKSLNDDNIRDKEEANKQKDLYLLRYQQNERDKDNLLLKNNEMNDMLLKNQAMLDQLKGDNDNLIRKREIDLQNKDAIIEDLKNQIDYLRDEISKCQDDKNKMQDYYGNIKKNDEKRIDDLSNKLGKLNDENERLNRDANENKRLNNKLLDEKKRLVERVNDLSKDLNDANLNNKRQQRRYGSPTGKDNQIFSSVLKNENDDLKDLIEKYRQMLNILFKFINDLNDIFEHPEINIDQCCKDISILIDDVNQLKDDIQKLLDQRGYTNREEKKKWDDMQEKLLNRNYNNMNQKNINLDLNNKKRKMKKLEVENDWNSGNCWACKIGRNVSLRGCSPYLCQKHKFTSEY